MKRLVTVLLTLLLGLPACALASDQTVDSNTLIEDASVLDGQTVVYRGELIGDVLTRGNYEWLNVSDGSNAIGIWTEKRLLNTALIPGRYGQKGDTLGITGVFHRSCREHGGDMDIHAMQIEILAHGSATPSVVVTWRVVAAVILTCADLCMLAWFLLAKRKALL